MTIKVQTYTFHCRCESETRLPEYSGSTLRGGLGMALKQIACALRRKEGNDLTHALPFHVLVRACLRRIAALEAAYGGGEPELDYSGLVARAREVRGSRSRLGWQDLRRYSNRQKTTVSLSGLCGDVTYEGELTEFLSILRYGEQVHIGKQTVFGLGRIRVEEGKQKKNVDLD